MIKKLQKKIIFTCSIIILSVISVVFVLSIIFNFSSMNKNIDNIADNIAFGNGKFPNHFKPNSPDFNPETPFSTRFFTVDYNEFDEIIRVNLEAIHAVDEEEAKVLARSIKNRKHGWIVNYRYNVYERNMGKTIVFIDGSMDRSSLARTLFINFIILFSCSFVVLILIVLFSKRIVKPIAESYNKQRQFITDANHELKTPLTLILANVDIAEAELGKNEWLSDIREESLKMSVLVNQLVDLSRMDEESYNVKFNNIEISDLIRNMAIEFSTISKDISVNTRIKNEVVYYGDEELIKRLFSILFDNAFKYCDSNGVINVTLKKDKNIIILIENTYKEVNNLELTKLFNRFYRSDKSRTYSGSYGIGLSIAESIVLKHKGNISAYKKDDKTIGFKVILK